MEHVFPVDLELPLTSRESLFIQIKVSEWMKTQKALQWSVTKSPYFRFKLHRSLNGCEQHNLLKFLSGQSLGSVYYAAPMFTEYSDYANYWKLGGVLANSAFLPVAQLDYILDNDEHWIVFQQTGKMWQCSDAIFAGRFESGYEIAMRLSSGMQLRSDNIQRERGRLERQPFLRIHDKIPAELAHMRKVLMEGIEQYSSVILDFPAALEDLAPWQRDYIIISQILEVYYGVAWVMVY